MNRRNPRVDAVLWLMGFVLFWYGLIMLWIEVFGDEWRPMVLLLVVAAGVVLMAFASPEEDE